VGVLLRSARAIGPFGDMSIFPRVFCSDSKLDYWYHVHFRPKLRPTPKSAPDPRRSRASVLMCLLHGEIEHGVVGDYWYRPGEFFSSKVPQWRGRGMRPRARPSWGSLDSITAGEAGPRAVGMLG
jgi:hypothetical protein